VIFAEQCLLVVLSLLLTRLGRPTGVVHSSLLFGQVPGDELTIRTRPVFNRYAFFSHTETCVVLSLVKGSRFQPLQRSRRVMPASRAIRSSSDGHT
jgi:hypothetical protein